MTRKQKMKHRNVTLKLNDDNRNNEKHKQNKNGSKIEKEKNAEPQNKKEKHPNQREEEIEKDEEIITRDLQSEDKEKKAEVVGKADNNKEQATKRQTNKQTKGTKT